MLPAKEKDGKKENAPKDRLLGSYKLYYVNYAVGLFAYHGIRSAFATASRMRTLFPATRRTRRPQHCQLQPYFGLDLRRFTS